MISLDLREVTGISFFSLNFLNILIHSVSHQYGVIWEVGTEPARTQALYKFLFFRTFEVNNLFMRNKPLKVQDTELYIDGFGTKIFDKDIWGNIFNGFENYLSGLGHKFPEYLSRYVSIKYDYKFRAIRSDSAFFTYYNLISSIISELAENVGQHSEGIGYLSAMVAREKLYLFVGDCGVGLRRGILKNYAMDHEIVDDQSALSFLFKLYEYKSRRKEDPSFNIGAGYGLKDALSHIFACKGKFVFGSGNSLGSFMNPVQKAASPSKLMHRYLRVDGTHYMILIPLSEKAAREIPDTTEVFMTLEE